MTEKEFKEVYLPLLIKHFDLTDETIDSLNEQLFFEEIAKDRVRITKMNNLDLTYTINKGIHEVVKDKLKKYADEKALECYKEDYGNAFNTSINDYFASTFLVDIDKSPLEKTANSYSMGNYEIVEVEYKGKTYYVAWF